MRVTLVATALCLFAVAPAAGGWRDFQRTAPPPPAVAPPVAEAAPETAVLDPGAGDPIAEELAAENSAAGDTAAGKTARERTAVDEMVSPPSGDVQPVTAESPADPSAAPCGEDAEDCRRALDRLRSDTLAGIDLDIRVGGRPGSDYPCECRLEGETYEPRRFATTTFTWKAAGYCHKPLYFEHWNLERYGHSHGFLADTALSAAHFFARIPALPYELGVELPWECVYPLGYYRPGSCAPWTVPAVPFSLRGAAVGAATATGIVFILP